MGHAELSLDGELFGPSCLLCRSIYTNGFSMKSEVGGWEVEVPRSQTSTLH